MSYIRDRLRERHVDLRKTPVILDDEGGHATFMLHNLLGQLIGYQRYKPSGDKSIHNDPDKSMYYTHMTEGHQYAQAWGFHSLGFGDDFLLIVEGIFDAIRLHNLNLPAVAVMCNCPSQALGHYLSFLGRPLIGILDNDDNGSGDQLAWLCSRSFLTPDPYKDLGEVPTDEEVAAILANWAIMPQ